MSSEASREERRARRMNWPPGEIIETGDPEPALYAGLDADERFRAMAELCFRQAVASGHFHAAPPRDEWPIEVFEIDELGSATR